MFKCCILDKISMQFYAFTDVFNYYVASSKEHLVNTTTADDPTTMTSSQ